MTRAVVCAGLVAIAVPAPVAAQSNDRLQRLEQQVNALQRAVFPGGDDRFFEPEITPERALPQDTSPQVTTSALTDVLARLEAIEGQLARLTAATEVNENALSSVETRLTAMEGSDIAAVTTSSTGPASQSSTTSAGPSGVIAVPSDNRTSQTAPASSNVAAASSSTSEPAAGPSPERLQAVQGIAKPATGDAGDDEYTYGFRLWDAGFYPEAQQQLAMFVEQYPNHWRTTYGRNLLGRAFLDAGEPRAAATHFFDNYQSDGNGARAPDSLLYLVESMIALGDTRRACIALAEFGESYAALAAGRLADMYGDLGGRVDCN
ncbi:tetratricopeptide repeat protein [Aurantiacibacter rhizosphaerae]|uniref:Tetratricopeptide repeat protein n=1 Tax=Aurantiacibacter rhizosphaerae TaxID=2691582 RepID=A0A844X9X7_9SPHN|nr:tetratricopeptide repeat protein [Aurantiacibacter rhizosphaerae]MWV27241.1 hypothetical protein [Aurantiacibacter rhizosphaerae]